VAEIAWVESALNDMNDIAEYIALDNPLAASYLVNKILQKVERLVDFPESGRGLPELPSLNYREIIINPCRIIYKYQGEQVIILGVLRQERDLLRYIAESNNIQP